MTWRYVEHPPPAALAAWVECSWEISGGETDTARSHRVLPDGCMDLVWTAQAHLEVAGPDTTAFVALLPAGTGATGVRLHPGGAPPLFGMPAPELLDTHCTPGELWGLPGQHLQDTVGQAGTPEGRRAVLLAWLSERAKDAPTPEPLIAAVVSRFLRGAVTVGALADEFGYSERHLYRTVESQVGYGPKRLARILRLRRALTQAAAQAARKPGVRPGLSLARVAYDNGYADQPHFANDCLALAGVSPTALLAGMAPTALAASVLLAG